MSAETEQRLYQMLGELLAGQRHGTDDRREIKQSIVEIHQRMDGLVALPQRFATHEEADENRFAALGDAGNLYHADNTKRLDKIEATLRTLVTERDQRTGASALVHALSAALGALIAAAATFLKMRGH